MDPERLVQFPIAPIESFPENCAFGQSLSAGKTTGIREFRGRYRKVLDRLVFVILNNSAVS